MRRAITLLALAIAAPALADWDGRIWNDGRAEVAIYESKALVDSKPRDFRETLLTSKEEQGRNKAFRFTVARTVEGANQPYHQNVTVLLDAKKQEEVLKIVASQQDWAGTVTKTLLGSQLTISSSRAGEQESVIPLELTPADLFEDALPITLRSLPFKEGLQVKGRLWATFATDSATAPAVVPVVVTVTGEDVVRGRAGSIPSWKVTVEREGGPTDTYWFEKKDPRVLTRMDRADGLKRVLFGRARWSYWDKRLPRPNILN